MQRGIREGLFAVIAIGMAIAPTTARAWTADSTEVSITVTAPAYGTGGFAARFCAASNSGYAADQAATDASASSANGVNNGAAGTVSITFKRNYNKAGSNNGYVASVRGYGHATGQALRDSNNGSARGKGYASADLPNQATAYAVSAERPVSGNYGASELEFDETGTETLNDTGYVSASAASTAEAYSAITGDEGSGYSHVSLFFSTP